jgi:glycosyltransferase involved in cell wall biosynthesis
MKTDNPGLHSPSILASGWVRRINRSDADVVHLHWVQGEMLSVKDISRIKKPVIWTMHDMWAICGAEHYSQDSRWQNGYSKSNRPTGETGFDLNRWVWGRKKKHWNRELQIIAPSHWMANAVGSSDIMHGWPVGVIPNPVDIDVWRPMPMGSARGLLGLPEGVPILLFGAIGGAEDPRKGFQFLLQALSILKSREALKDLHLVVFGQSDKGINSILPFPVHYLGNLTDDQMLMAAYSAADLMAVPSIQDNLPQTATESMACGTPVLAFEVGGLSDIVSHEKSGYLAKLGDAEDLAHGAQWLLSLQENEAHRMSRFCREQAIEKYSYSSVGAKYSEYYKLLVS